MGLFISIWIIGLFCIYQSRKTSAKLLFQLGLATVSGALIYLGAVIDVLAILLTGNNSPFDPRAQIPGTFICWGWVLDWMWVAPAYILGIYVGITLLTPKRKRYIVPVTLVLGVIFEASLFFDYKGSIVDEYPVSPGENVIEGTLMVGSLAFIVIFIFTLSFLIIAFGLLIKSIQSTGVLRKKYLIFSLGFFFITIGGLSEQLVPMGITAIFYRIGTIIGFWFFYLALREEPEKRKKIRPEKKVVVKGSIFRITKRPDHLTEEEVSISKEKKICLICKGKVARINYICPECDALYCIKCVEVLSNSENACWVCETPFDETRLSKPFKKDEEKEEILEKPEKKYKS